jgi:plastocyanin
MKTLKTLIAASIFLTTASSMAELTIAGCTKAQFIMGAEVNQISTSGMSYTPKCLRIKAGSTVTIQAGGHHPLSAMPDIDGARNPFATTMSASQPQTRKMDQPGIYGYFCENHGDKTGSGMAGVIVVE